MSEDTVRENKNPEPEIGIDIFVNRIVREVPLDWQHPQDERGFRPLMKYGKFESIYYSGMTDEEARNQYEKDKQNMMPDFSSRPKEEMGICAYETFAEGTPISPVFPNTPQGRFELAKYCADNAFIFARKRANLVEWANVLFNDVPHTIDIQSGKIEIF